MIEFLGSHLQIAHLSAMAVIGLAVFLGTVGGRVFERFHIPQVVGNIFIGLLLGRSVLGLIGYAIILGLWAMQWLGSEALRKKTDWLLPAVIWFGVAFSAYLTFLEPFVIGAVCMWCITSALIMTALLYLTYRWRVPER
jgi:uncharacterized membrane protein